MDWPFDDPQNVATITLRQIMAQDEIIDRVWHDEEDGQWQFLSSGVKSSMQNAMLVSLKSIVALDPTVIELNDLPLGWRAWRSAKDQPWQRAPADDE